jgi:hypothetical protein
MLVNLISQYCCIFVATYKHRFSGGNIGAGTGRSEE